MKNRKLLLAVVLVLLAAVAAAVYFTRTRDAPQAPAVATEAPTAAPTPDPTAEPTQVPPTTAPTEAPTPRPTLQIDPNAGALITPTPAPVEPGVAIPGWGSMTIPAGVTEAATSMRNPAENDGWYYLTFELRLPTVDAATGQESYELLFTTGLIPPGQYCNKVTLTRPLEAGEYKAVVHVQPYRMSDQSPTNNADMETTLIVQ